MKTKELIERLQRYYELSFDARVEISKYLSPKEVDEIIQRLKELEELKKESVDYFESTKDP